MAAIRVVVVDDSALVRTLLSKLIGQAPDIEVVGTASDPYAAREMIRALDPDVITLDVEMPRMDGLNFLERLMRLRPMPVVMVSTLTERGAEVTLRALELGAVDFVTKPKVGIAQGLEESAREIIDKIRIASRARVARRAGSPAGQSGHSAGSSAGQSAGPLGAVGAGRGGDPVASPAPLPSLAASGTRLGTEKLIAIGASTGGTEAIREVLVRLPADSPAVVITQHMPPGYTRSFAQRLDGLCRIRVKEAEHGERVIPGHAYIAPGGLHLRVDRSGANYVVALDDGEPVNRHKPSVEVLFLSVARNVGPNAVGVMLTGMGKDGASAMLQMREAGAWNIAQDEASCVVYGMPREAVTLGAVHETLPVTRIAESVLEHLLARSGGMLTRV